MLNIDVEDLIIRDRGSYEIKSIPMEVNEKTVCYFQRISNFFKKKYLEKLELEISEHHKVIIYWNYDYHRVAIEDCYNYIKSNINGFTEYIDKQQNKYLINDSLYAGTEKYDWGICIRFVNGDGVSLNL